MLGAASTTAAAVILGDRRLQPKLQLRRLDLSLRIKVLIKPLIWSAFQRLICPFLAKLLHCIAPCKMVIYIKDVRGIGNR